MVCSAAANCNWIAVSSTKRSRPLVQIDWVADVVRWSVSTSNLTDVIKTSQWRQNQPTASPPFYAKMFQSDGHSATYGVGLRFISFYTHHAMYVISTFSLNSCHLFFTELFNIHMINAGEFQFEFTTNTMQLSSSTQQNLSVHIVEGVYI